MCLFLGDRYKNGLPCATGPLSCMSVVLLHWYIVGKRLDGSRFKMLLAIELSLDPGDIVLDGDPAPPTETGTVAPHFLAHVYCGQTVAHLSKC